MAVKGNVPRDVVSRERFFKEKDIDPYVGLVWSFGNDRRTYAFSKDREEIQMAVFETLTGDTLKKRYEVWNRHLRKLNF